VVCVDTGAILFTIFPHTFIFAKLTCSVLVWPYECSMARFEPIFVLAFINAAILPSENAVSMHLVVEPVTIVFLTVGPYKVTLPMKKVFLELSFIYRPINHLLHAMSLLHSIFKVPLVS
jgi:hypothetical protein